MTSRTSVLLVAVVTAFSLATAHAQNETYNAVLSGPAESPPNASPGTGFSVVIINPVTNLLHVEVNFSGLLGTTTASHIHAATPSPFAGTAMVATQTPTFSGFPLGVTSGTYMMDFDMSQTSTWNMAFITAHGGTAASAEADFISAVRAGEAYLNIHTTVVPGGEIRGFLVAAPENGASASLLLIALAGLAVTAYRVRRTS